jgi:hypothetical protein
MVYAMERGLAFLCQENVFSKDKNVMARTSFAEKKQKKRKKKSD